MGGGLSMGLRFHLNEYLDFHSSATYFILEKTFDDIQFNDQNVSTSLNLTYETLCINFGIAYRFVDDQPLKHE
jgi:hypothetical protein